MDAEGARHLQRRIEQQQHWQLAEAVRDGRAPATDPDADQLTEMRDGVRVYGSERGEGTIRTFVKRLVDGHWRGAYEERAADADLPHLRRASAADERQSAA